MNDQWIQRYRRPLYLATLFYLLAAVAFMLLGQVDARLLDNGEGVWIKPARFALSFAVLAATLLWIAHIGNRQECRDWLFVSGCRLMLLVMLVEIALITLQAARGVPSHFNVGSAFDSAVFSAIGIATTGLFVGFALIVAGFIRKPAYGPVNSLLIAGLVFAIAGGLVGVWMTMPTPAQTAMMAEGLKPAVVGSHAVGIESGFRVPLFGWDKVTGDWRLLHFLGIHALQLLPLFAWLLVRNRVTGTDAWITATTGIAAFTLLFGYAFYMTLHNFSLFRHEPYTVAIFVLVLALLLNALWHALYTPLVRPERA